MLPIQTRTIRKRHRNMNLTQTLNQSLTLSLTLSLPQARPQTSLYSVFDMMVIYVFDVMFNKLLEVLYILRM